VVLEGGYDLAALRDSASATVRGLAGETFDPEASLESPPGAGAAVDHATTAIARHWRL
jgi:acetoin utilization deacetylase AcuC-like enzyme